MDGCGWCDKFNPTWDLLVKDYKKYVDMMKYEMNDATRFGMIQRYNIKSYPTIILVKNDKHFHFNYDDRTIENFLKFFDKHKIKID